MEMDAIKIETDVTGNRTGFIINTQYEEALQNGNHSISYQEELVYKIFRRNVSLFGIELLTDGNYPIELFQKEFLAASIVEPGMPLPLRESIDYYRYIEDEELE
ncbi:hypothetical protein [Mucilaginibacter polytrichastri]|uniref:hypothetical protein n=1 Tax=Mucilaginibacter polytrichastri TaxID=1302689 RepID=UPI0008EA3D2D|nr:hypothetical protein [Mucilaginibacter polytrichastri]SFS98376.1 hypothetical protein SAMN04487890_107270 [Mucilaginibacter polytrichastri]